MSTVHNIKKIYLRINCNSWLYYTLCHLHTYKYKNKPSISIAHVQYQSYWIMLLYYYHSPKSLKDHLNMRQILKDEILLLSNSCLSSKYINRRNLCYYAQLYI